MGVHPRRREREKANRGECILDTAYSMHRPIDPPCDFGKVEYRGTSGKLTYGRVTRVAATLDTTRVNEQPQAMISLVPRTRGISGNPWKPQSRATDEEFYGDR
jgi:hypothetical protein